MTSIPREDYEMVDGGGHRDREGQELCFPGVGSAHVSVTSWGPPGMLLGVTQGRR